MTRPTCVGSVLPAATWGDAATDDEADEPATGRNTDCEPRPDGAKTHIEELNGVACQIDRWNFELTLITDEPKSNLFRPFSCIMSSFDVERIRLTSLEVGRCHTASSDVRWH